jgi:2Fe-2S ferredoxin
MLQESFAHASDDMNARALAEAQVEADRIVAATESAIARDGDLLDEQERRTIDDLVARSARRTGGGRSGAPDGRRGSAQPRHGVLRGAPHGPQRRACARGQARGCGAAGGQVMPEVVVLPHAELCPDGKTFEAKKGVSLLDNLLDQGIEVEHACEKSCACTTCHCIVRKGYDSLSEASEDEEDLLDRAWGLTPCRGCRARRSSTTTTSWSRSRSTRSTTPKRASDGGRT